MFGKYNPAIDESVHLILALITPLILLLSNSATKEQAILVFLIAIAIDIDHFLNPVIARHLNIQGTILPSKEQQGYTIKILHGIDLYIVYSLIFLYTTNNIALSVGIFTTLTLHHWWDFVVFDHSWQELFLFTRARMNFHPGYRKSNRGLIFKSESLPM